MYRRKMVKAIKRSPVIQAFELGPICGRCHMAIETALPVARREVFVSVSAFKPKVKNVLPRAWTEPIAVLLLLSS
jgi:hypothetical protein